jgi:hypothetical protein
VRLPWEGLKIKGHGNASSYCFLLLHPSDTNDLRVALYLHLCLYGKTSRYCLRCMSLLHTWAKSSMHLEAWPEVKVTAAIGTSSQASKQLYQSSILLFCIQPVGGMEEDEKEQAWLAVNHPCPNPSALSPRGETSFSVSEGQPHLRERCRRRSAIVVPSASV